MARIMVVAEEDLTILSEETLRWCIREIKNNGPERYPSLAHYEHRLAKYERALAVKTEMCVERLFTS